MADQVTFDALELARLANAEIDDMRRMARAPDNHRPVEAESSDKTVLPRVFRAPAKGG